MSADVSTVWQLFPLPHGTQRQAINQPLKEQGWHARPLQPRKGRGNVLAHWSGVSSSTTCTTWISAGHILIAWKPRPTTSQPHLGPFLFYDCCILCILNILGEPFQANHFAVNGLSVVGLNQISSDSNSVGVLLPGEAFGFSPTREAPQIYSAEHCLQTTTPVGGISTDVIKACIQRDHVFHVASHAYQTRCFDHG